MEVEREKMKSVLEGMGEGLRNLAVHMRPHDVNMTSEADGDVIMAEVRFKFRFFWPCTLFIEIQQLPFM